MGLVQKIRENYSKKEIKRIRKQVDATLALEKSYAALSDAELQAKTPELRARLANGASLDDILPEAFAACREAAWRVLKMKHYPVQIIGGILLHQGRIAEMRTGEGKTLVATLPAYLNGLTGKGVHIVTVNDYLARRDSEWMGKVYSFMGLTVGLVVHDVESEQRHEAYAADITYGTNNEMGFDYLRDNMVQYKEQKVQRAHVFAIVDEVDSILIDEARTPLIISGRGEASTELYQRANSFAKGLEYCRVKELNDKKNAEEVAGDADVLVDEKAKTSTLTQNGVHKAERYFGVENLMDAENMQYSHHINQAIRAYGIMKRDVDYMVADGQVLIIDEFTGRVMHGRRYSEGQHQAIEAKEGVKIENEMKTLATITFQNYFRLYSKLSGMTGTAMTERDEFMEIYNLDVVEAPTHKNMIRTDHPDVVYRTEMAKYHAVIKQIALCHEKGQPVLVGTVSVEKSELLSRMLQAQKIAHNVLNAKNHQMEAEIVAQAGTFGAVTIATNMAGRGTDIMLGGNAEYMTRSEMRRMGFSREMISEAQGFAENPEIIKAKDELRKSKFLKMKVKDLVRKDMRQLGYDEKRISKADSYSITQDKNILEARRKFNSLKNGHIENLITEAVNYNMLIVKPKQKDKLILEVREKFVALCAEFREKIEEVRKIYAELEAEHKEEIKPKAAQVVAAGGLFIIGTERHESRRIDNQLRGRAGRQGDPGESRFYLSMEDDLMRLFGGENLGGIMDRVGMDDSLPLSMPMLSRSMETAQKRVENRNFEMRKNVLDYDDVMNEQRELIYSQRRRALHGENLSESIKGMFSDVVERTVKENNNGSDYPEEWNLPEIFSDIDPLLGSRRPLPEELTELSSQEAENILKESVLANHQAREEELTEEMMREIERISILRAVDMKWMEHLDAMDQLRQGIGLQAYGQRNPLVEYKFEAYNMFQQMIEEIQSLVCRLVLSARITVKSSAPREMRENRSEDHTKTPFKKCAAATIGRNDLCPCGSGKKYKKCCGQE